MTAVSRMADRNGQHEVAVRSEKGIFTSFAYAPLFHLMVSNALPWRAARLGNGHFEAAPSISRRM
jgi:hypothetical protein